MPPPGLDGLNGDGGPVAETAAVSLATKQTDGTESTALDRMRDTGYDAFMKAADDEFVRQSFRRCWDPKVRRLRRQLRGAG